MIKNNHKILYVKPDIISYAHHAFPLGIIMSVPESEAWFMTNYINLYYRPGMNSFNFLVEYDNNPFLDMRNIYKRELDWLSKNNMLYEWIRSELNNGIAVELIIDYFYLPLSKYFQNAHYMHEILITGYSDDNFYFWWFNHDQYQQNICSFNEIIPFDSEKIYGDGVIGKLLSPKYSKFTFDESLIWKQLRDYSTNADIHEQIVLWGDNNQYSSCKFGIQCIDFLLDEIRRNQNATIDFRYINIFYEHKKCMRMRFNKMGYPTVASKWQELENDWKIIMFSILRYIKYDEMAKSSIEQLEKICNLITSVKKKEHDYLYYLLQ